MARTTWYVNGDLPTDKQVQDDSLTTGDLTATAVACGALYGSFDTALPQAWVDDVVLITGIYPSLIVWEYPPRGGIFGRPFGLTVEAVDLIARYEREKGLVGR